MNINTVIKRIKRDIGIYGIALPINNLDEMILDIIYDTTLPVFSIYCPYVEPIPIDITLLNREHIERPDGSTLYIVPDSVLNGRELLYVKGLDYDESYLNNNSSPIGGLYNSTGLEFLEELMVANVGMQIGNAMIKHVSFHYEHPRKVYIYDDLISSRLVMWCAFQHDKSFASITPTSQESFYLLAALDVKMGLYNTVKHYKVIETPLGRTELDLSDWESAKDDRKSLIQDWDENYLLDAVDLDYE